LHNWDEKDVKSALDGAHAASLNGGKTNIQQDLNIFE
jgi:hypothetical protein